MGVSVHVNIPSVAYGALQGAANAWNNAGSSFKFYYAGLTTATTSYSSPDNIHVIWSQNTGDTGTLAVNYFWYYISSGELIDSDIEFNTYYPWSLSGGPNKYDIQSVATHELGHSLNLGDLYGPFHTEKTMYGYTSKGETKQRTLHQDDINGIRFIYPH